MKKLYKFLMPLVAIVAMALPWSAQAQLTLTVADGTATNGYVPVYGFYADAYLQADFVYPATDLVEMTGGTISSMTFFSSSSSISWGVANFVVSIKEIGTATLTGYASDEGFTEVYNGALSISDDGQMVVNFETSYPYTGSNLLVRVQNTVTGSYVSCTWLGVSSTGSSYQGYSYSSISSVAENARNFLPKVEFSYMPGSGDFCFPVRNILASGITSDGCTLTWMDTLNSGATYTVYNMADTSVVGTTSTTTYTITGLSSNTVYQFGIVSDCGSGTVSSYAKTNVRTACGGFTSVPYSEDFEDTEDGEMPNCWQAVSTSTSGSGTFPSVYQYSYNAHSGSNYFEFESSNGETEIAALPSMDNVSGLKLVFWASAQASYLPVLEVGVMEDTVFVPIDTISLTTSYSWSSGYNRYVVFFSEYSGSGDRIAMRTTGTAGSQYTLMMDDFEVVLADIPEITSMPVSLSTNINTDLVITATVGGNMTSGTYTWTSTMADAGNAIMTPADNVLTINYSVAGTDTVTLFAGNSYGEDTAYTIVNARDLSPVTVLPYTTGFEEDEDLNWTLVNDLNNGWVIDTAVNNTVDGNTSLYISNDGGVTNGYNISTTANSYAIRYFQLDAGEYALSFDWHCQGEASSYGTVYDYMNAYVAPSDADLFSDNIDRSSWTVIAEKLVGQSTWQNFAGTFTVETAGIYPIIFYWHNDDSQGSDPAAAVDNIELIQNTCPSVTNIVIDSIGEDNVTLHWHPVGDETSWHVTIGEDYDAVVYDTIAIVTDLSSSTNYTISVVALCGPDDSSLPATTTFRTTCGTISTLPWSEDFEDQTTTVAPDCWTVYGGNPRVMTSMPHGGARHLYFSDAYRNMIALPQFAAPINTLQVRFWTRPESPSYSNCGTFSVGYMTDADDSSTFVAVQTFNYADFIGYEEKEVEMNAASDSAVVIAFRHNANSSSYYWYVDDVVVETIPACAHPASITAEATSNSEIDVTIVGGNDATNFRLYWTDGTTVDSVDVTTSTHTITGLSSSTMYTVSVASVCDDGSVTSTVYTTAKTLCATTGCDLFVVMEDSYGDGWNGNAVNGFIAGVQVFSATIASGSYDTLVYQMCDNESIELRWHSGSYPSETSFEINVGGEPIANGGGSDYSDGQTIAVASGCPSCSRPSTIAAVSTSESQIAVTLTGDAAGSYRIYWADSTATDSTDVVGLTYTITGLTASTLYTVSAVTICDDASLSMPISTTCRTQCAGGGCNLTITMHDSYGDGWNNNAIIGYVNGVMTFTATFVDGYDDTYTYSMCNSDNILLLWSEGSFSSETSFIIENGEEIISAGGGSYYEGDTVAVVSGCPTCMKPIDLTIDNTDTNQIDFHWTSVGTESSWQVFVNGVLVATTTTTSYSATGLANSSSYNLAVRAICGDGDTSNYLTGSAMTLSIPATLPYSTGFEAGESWLFANGTQTNKWFVGSATNNGGSNALYISDNNGDTNHYNTSSTSNVYAYKMFDFDVTGDYAISYDWSAYGESNYDYIRVFLVPSSVDLVAGDANGIGTTSTPTGWVALDGGSKLNLSSTWQTHSEVFNISVADTYNVVFFWHNDLSSGVQPPAAIDNISIAQLSCPAPTDVMVSNVSGTSADIAWTAGDAESQWEVVVNDVSTTVSSPFFHVSGLANSTSYSVRVRAICGDGDSSFFTQTVTFTTSICDNGVSVYNFDSSATSTTSSYSPVGYSFYNYSYVQTIIPASRLASLSGPVDALGFNTASTSAGDHFTNMTVYMANVAEDNLDSAFIHPDPNHIFVQVKANADLNYTTTGWQIFSLDNTFQWDGTSNVLVAFLRNHGSWASGSSFEAHSDSVARTRYAYTDGGAYNIDSVTGGTALTTVGDLMLISCNGTSCNDPAIISSSVNETTATVNFISQSDTNEVVIMPGTWVAPANGTEIYTSTHTFTGLTPSTQYTIGVRAVCGEDRYSEWSLTSVTTTDHPCLVPTNVTVSAQTYDGATVSWTPGENETEWQVKVFCASPQYEAVYTVNDNPTVVVDGLTNGVTYSVTVLAMCGANWYSEWSDTVDLTTATCAQVTGVSASNLTATSATINWTSTGANSYEIEYGTGGFTAGTGTTVTSTTNSVNINDLEEQTPYDVYVRGVCGEGVFSLWSEKYSFTTPEATQGIDDVENDDVTLFPNPASTMVTIRGIEGMSQVTVVDLNGREIFKANAEGSLTIDVSGYAKGAYFVRITGERATAIRKLVVK